MALLGIEKVYSVKGKKFRTKASAIAYAKKVNAKGITVTTYDKRFVPNGKTRRR